MVLLLLNGFVVLYCFFYIGASYVHSIASLCGFVTWYILLLLRSVLRGVLLLSCCFITWYCLLQMVSLLVLVLYGLLLQLLHGFLALSLFCNNKFVSWDARVFHNIAVARLKWQVKNSRHAGQKSLVGIFPPPSQLIYYEYTDHTMTIERWDDEGEDWHLPYLPSPTVYRGKKMKHRYLDAVHALWCIRVTLRDCFSSSCSPFWFHGIGFVIIIVLSWGAIYAPLVLQ